MNINDYGMNAYKETLYKGFKRNMQKADETVNTEKQSPAETPKIPPPDTWGRIMDFKI